MKRYQYEKQDISKLERSPFVILLFESHFALFGEEIKQALIIYYSVILDH